MKIIYPRIVQLLENFRGLLCALDSEGRIWIKTNPKDESPWKEMPGPCYEEGSLPGLPSDTDPERSYDKR